MPGLEETIAVLRRRQSQFASCPAAQRMREFEQFGANPGALRALYYGPRERGGTVPLVVALHGCAQEGEAYAEHAGWLDLADAFQFAVLAPEQTRANNANLCFNWFEPHDTHRGEGEAASIAEMIAYLTANEGIDAKHVFISGLSAGGAMSAAMLATYPELFAGGAVIAGLPFGAANNLGSALAAMARAPGRTPQQWGDLVRGASTSPAAWPPITIWHGDRDHTVRPAAGEALVAQWRNLHALDDVPETRAIEDGRTTLTWASNGTSLVTFHKLRDLGHGVPLRTIGDDGWGASAPYMLDVGISSSYENAAQWGLTRAPGTPPKPHPVDDTLLAPSTRARRLDLHGVIASALRKAGLLK